MLLSDMLLEPRKTLEAGLDLAHDRMGGFYSLHMEFRDARCGSGSPHRWDREVRGHCEGSFCGCELPLDT